MTNKEAKQRLKEWQTEWDKAKTVEQKQCLLYIMGMWTGEFHGFSEALDYFGVEREKPKKREVTYK